MYYEYSLLSSIIGSAITLILIRFASVSLKKKKTNSSAETNAKASKATVRLDSTLNIIIFFLAFVALAKIIFIAFFPFELAKFSLVHHILSLRSFFLIIQQFIALTFVFIIFIILLYSQLKYEFRFIFLKRVLNISLFFVLLDVVLSSMYFTYISSELLLTEKLMVGIKSFSTDPFTVMKEYFLLFISLIIFLFFYLRFQRKRNQLNTVSYLLAFVFTYSLIIYFTVLYAHYFFESEILLSSALQIFPGIVSFWFLLLITGIGCQIFSLIILALKKQFFNIHQSTLYIIQLNRVSFVCTAGLSAVAVLPIILRIFVV